MNISQSPADSKIKSLLSQSPAAEEQNECLLQDEILSDLPIVDEVTISTAEASLSSVISSSLQVVSRATLEDEPDDCSVADGGVHDPTDDDVCDAMDGSIVGASPEPSLSSNEELLGEDDLVNVARSTDSGTEKWQSALQRKRSCTEVII